MANLTNINDPQVANRAFVQIALDLGAESLIRSMVGEYAITEKRLLELLIGQLEGPQPDIAAALNIHSLRAIVSAIAVDLENATVMPVSGLIPLADEDGPASVTASRGTGKSVDVTFTDYPSITDAVVSAEVYIDRVFAKHVSTLASGGIVSTTVQVANDGKEHVIQVLYRIIDNNGIMKLSRFGDKATVT